MGEPTIYDKGVEGKAGNGGVVTRPGCTYVVCLQTDLSDDPIPYFFAKTQEDAKEYCKAMKSSGQGNGLRIVKKTDYDGQVDD